MPLKKSTGNMYSWVTHTWNPVRGKCGYGCSYCYVKKWGEPGRIHLDEKELRADLGAGNIIFVCSGCDLFHPDIPLEWIVDILLYTSGDYNKNTYLWHTKNPGFPWIPDWYFPEDSILCTTIETNRRYDCMRTAPLPLERMAGLSTWKKRRMVTVEPILDFDEGKDGFARLILNCKPEQVNIGADSGRNNLPEPSREKVEDLIELLAPYTKIHLKKNLRRLLPESRYYGTL